MMERVKIGQDLHDAVGADLVRITMILNRPDDVPREELARIAREANRTLRDIIWTSSAPQTVDAVLAQILERIRTIAVEAGLELFKELSTHVAPYPMQATLIRDLVLIVTESITNIIKHARASVIRARITTSASKLHIAISDNGIGFDVNAAHQGMGLPGMRQRAERSGISLTIRSAPDAGSEVELIVSFEGVS
jgi:signal transduction histidine kinase